MKRTTKHPPPLCETVNSTSFAEVESCAPADARITDLSLDRFDCPAVREGPQLWRCHGSASRPHSLPWPGPARPSRTVIQDVYRLTTSATETVKSSRSGSSHVQIA